MNFLRQLRLKKGLTCEQIAESIGINYYTLRGIEHGKIICGELNARRLGEYFKMNWKKFLTEIKYKNLDDIPPEEENKVEDIQNEQMEKIIQKDA